MTAILEAEHLSLSGRLAPTDLVVDPGKLVAVVGPNGGGKTSLLRALANVERTSGTVRIDGEELARTAPARRPYLLTYAPASRDLVWPISVRDVIALGLTRPDRERVEDLIVLLELERLASRRVDCLSTGERARVIFARALASRPKVLLLDEALSNLDPYWTLRLLDILRATVSHGASALVALHDIDRLTAFDRALLMTDGAIRADLVSHSMLDSDALAEAFRIQRGSTGWQIRTPADPQSSR